MGSGKSSVGRALAALLGWPFVDLDFEIERREQRKIRNIFHEHGEVRFREIEADALRSLLADAPRPLVLATGGGTFVQPQNAQLLRDAGAVVAYLHASAETLLRRCCSEQEKNDESVRPLARDRDSFLRLYNERLPFYQSADLIFDSDEKAPSEVARDIVKEMGMGGERSATSG